MSLIQLGNGSWVNPHLIASIQVVCDFDFGPRCLVVMEDGDRIVIYGTVDEVDRERDRIATLVNGGGEPVTEEE